GGTLGTHGGTWRTAPARLRSHRRRRSRRHGSPGNPYSDLTGFPRSLPHGGRCGRARLSHPASNGVTMPEDHSDSGTPGRSWLDRITQCFSGERGNRDDLLELIRSLRERDILDVDTLGIIEGALQVSSMQVRDIMVPRAQMIPIRANTHPRDFLPVIIECAHSRFPVLGDDPDEVIGVMLAKDLLPLVLDPSRMERFNIKDHIRQAFIIPESKRLDSLLRDFRVSRNHMAIVVNEYGGVAGLVTIEDVLEQSVGEFEDEMIRKAACRGRKWQYDTPA